MFQNDQNISIKVKDMKKYQDLENQYWEIGKLIDKVNFMVLSEDVEVTWKVKNSLYDPNNDDSLGYGSPSKFVCHTCIMDNPVKVKELIIQQYKDQKQVIRNEMEKLLDNS